MFGVLVFFHIYLLTLLIKRLSGLRRRAIKYVTKACISVQTIIIHKQSNPSFYELNQ